MQPDFATTPSTNSAVDWMRQLAYRLHLPTTLVKFLIVGGIGFLISQFFLFIFYDTPVAWFMPAKDTDARLLFFTHSDVRLLISSIVAVEFAIVAQFNLHERWTFRHRERDGNIFARFAKFNLGSIVSPIVVVLTVNILTPILRDGAHDESLIGTLAPYIANTVGVLLGFIWNWTLNSLVIWPNRKAAEADL
jgi:putative flippase GtrA